jgi:putative nucleotidyltransferase with HDIG domain
MKKKLDVAELEIGMYVAELDRPWLETPFMFQGFELSTEEELSEIRRFCQYVYIDTEQSRVLPKESSKERQKDDQPENKKADPELEFEILKKHATPDESGKRENNYLDQTTLEQEIALIRETHDEALILTHEIMEDVRLGKSFNTEGAKQVVSKIVKSVIRNPDALACFTQLKHRDAYTAEHSLRVCILALSMGRHLGMAEEELQVLGIGAMLHDIGKMRIPLDILNKPGELTAKEAELVKKHVPLGVDILERTAGIPEAAIDVARSHHERYDGSGYIHGRKGDQISEFGLIGGIVDYYDAVTSDRAYHNGMSPHSALKIMYELRNKAFHGGLIEEFIRCMGIYPIGSVVEMNTGEVGVVVTMNRVRRLRPRVVMVLQANNVPYPRPQTVDLAQLTTKNGKAYEISTVVEPGLYGINPTDYLPVNPLHH